MVNLLLHHQYNKSAKIFNIKDKTQEDFFPGHTSVVTCIVITSDYKYVVSGSRDNTVRIWDILNKRQEAVLYGHNFKVCSIAISRDMTYIATG